LLSGCGWEVVSPSEAGVLVDVLEDGATYSDNARIKAQAFAQASSLAALADDSGLEVDALNGEPGALHHLNGWDGRDNDERIRILLEAMKDVPPERRTGRFRSVIAVVLPDGRVFEEEGVVEGLVSMAPSGEHGWGYDPVFILPERGVTLAELPEVEKNRVSHRGLAAAKMRERLKDLAQT
jgi:XTP/dITP diphosphohydrolase